MKVVVAYNGTRAYRGGPKYFYLLTKHLVRKGVEVEFVLDSEEGVDKLREICPEARHKLLDDTTTIGFSWKLARYLAKADFDLLHTGHVLPYFYTYNSKRKPLVFQPFGSGFFTLAGAFGRMSHLYWKTAQMVQRRCGNKADAVAAEGEWQVDEIMEIYRVDRDRVFVLPVGVETPENRKLIRDGVFRVLSVNGLSSYKGIDILVEAFGQADLPKSQLIIIGEGPEEENIHRLIDRLSLNGRVLHLKGVSENSLYDWYARSNVFVSLSAEKDMEMGILEAQAYGLPVISSKPMLVQGNGYAVPSRRVEDAARALRAVFREDRTKMEEASRELATKHDFNGIADTAISKYEELLCSR